MAKKKTLGEKIQQQLDKLEKLHEKEEEVIENISDIIYEDKEAGYGGTDPN